MSCLSVLTYENSWAIFYYAIIWYVDNIKSYDQSMYVNLFFTASSIFQWVSQSYYFILPFGWATILTVIIFKEFEVGKNYYAIFSCFW